MWFVDNAVTISRYVFVAISAALIPVSLKALEPRGKAKM